MNPKTKVKVRVADLMEAIRDRKAKAEAAYEEELVKYEAAVAVYQQENLNFLEAYATKQYEAFQKQVADAEKKWQERAEKIDEVRREVAAKPTTDIQWSLGLDYSGRNNLPVKPYRPEKPTRFNAPIMQLEMAADETVLISAEDFSSYLGSY